MMDQTTGFRYRFHGFPNNLIHAIGGTAIPDVIINDLGPERKIKLIMALRDLYQKERFGLFVYDPFREEMQPPKDKTLWTKWLTHAGHNFLEIQISASRASFEKSMIAAGAIRILLDFFGKSPMFKAVAHLKQQIPQWEKLNDAYEYAIFEAVVRDRFYLGDGRAEEPTYDQNGITPERLENTVGSFFAEEFNRDEFLIKRDVLARKQSENGKGIIELVQQFKVYQLA